jgi:hypothetical protein
MSKPRYVLALDQGTTSSRSIVFGRAGEVIAIAQKEFPQIYPQPGWVEQFAAALEARAIRVPFKCLMRADLVSAPVVHALRRAGCRTVWLGAESGSQRVLDAMDKVRTAPGTGFDITGAMWRLTHPANPGDWVQIVGIVTFAIVGGMFIAATRVRRARTSP